MLSIIYPLGLMVLVLGSILFGVATPSEAASVGALEQLLTAFSQSSITKNIMDNCVYETIKLTSMVFMILIGAIMFSLVLEAWKVKSLFINFD